MSSWEEYKKKKKHTQSVVRKETTTTSSSSSSWENYLETKNTTKNETTAVKKQNKKEEKSGWKKVYDTVSGVGGNLLMGVENIIPNTVDYIDNLMETTTKKILGVGLDKFVFNKMDIDEDKKKAITNVLGDKVYETASKASNSSIYKANETLNSEAMEQWRAKTIQSNIDKSEGAIGKYAAELAPSIGQNLGNTALTVVNPALGTTMFMTSAAGSYLDEGRAKGIKGEDLTKYATIMGSIEGLTERLLSGQAIGTGAKLLGAKEITKETITNITKSFGFQIGENFVQEAAIVPLNELTAQVTAGKEYADWDNIFQRSMKAGVDGAISSVVLNGVSVGVGSSIRLYNKMQNGQEVTTQEVTEAVTDARKAGIDVDQIAEQNIQEQINNLAGQQPTDNTAQIQGLQQAIEEETAFKDTLQDERAKQISQDKIDGLMEELYEATNAQEITEQKTENEPQKDLKQKIQDYINKNNLDISVKEFEDRFKNIELEAIDNMTQEQQELFDLITDIQNNNTQELIDESETSISDFKPLNGNYTKKQMQEFITNGNVKAIDNVNKFLRTAMENETDKVWKQRLRDAARSNIDRLTPNRSPLQYKREIVKSYMEYKNGANIDYSIVDNQNRKLTLEQQEHYKDNKARDEKGRLVTLYHATGADFDTFDLERAGQNFGGWSQYGKAIYLTSDKEKAKSWAAEARIPDVDVKIKEVYGNIKNPFDLGADYNETLSDIKEQYNIDEFVMRKGYRVIEMLDELGLDIAQILTSHGYDGIIDGDQYVVYGENQVKYVDNYRPTDSKNMMFSVSEDTLNDMEDNTEENAIDRQINQTMTMEEAKDMIQRAFGIGDIYNWFDGQYKNGDEWLAGEGSDSVALVIENEYQLQQKFLDKMEGLNDDYVLEDVLEAYINGTLTGKQKKNTTSRLDLTTDTGFIDDKFYSPKGLTADLETYRTANQRVTKANRDAVYKARADFITNAHNKGYIESLGLTQAEVNKKLRTWANYPKKAIDYSNYFNEGVSTQNRWTGIENSSILNTITISDQDLSNMVKDIKGNSDEWQRRYVTSTMLALDTHINYKELTYEFNSDMGGKRDSVLGDYSASNKTIRIRRDGQNTVAHETGHYIDNIWGEEIFGRGSLTDRNSIERLQDTEVKQWVTNFYNFLDNIENSSDIRNGYTMSSNEVFARFVARFVEWTKNVATSNRYGYESKFYRDNFVESQYREFVKLLQEKAKLDTTKSDLYKQDIIKTDQVLDDRIDDIYNQLFSEKQVKKQVEEAIAPLQETIANLTEQVQAMQENIVPTAEQYKEVQPTQPTIEELNNLMDIYENKSGSEYASAFFALRDKYGEPNLYKALNEHYSRAKKGTTDMQENAAPTSQDIVEQQGQEAFSNITDDQAPIDTSNMSFEDVVDAVVSDYAGVEVETKSPLDNRDIDEVGNRSIKAYQYENPEVKPYFQTEAQNMLYDLDNTIKGEKGAAVDEFGEYHYYGITRQTTEAIAYLKDNYGYSYDQIRQGLNKIIEDDGKENNAVSKRIEFMLDERLREGYTTSDGIPIPANEEYIKFLEEKQITQYNKEAFEAITDDDIPMEKQTTQEDYGYHYGDLGKAKDTNYFSMSSSRRSTGHFGNGTYFVSGKESNVGSLKENRPVQKVDFSEYNLFKPTSESEAKDLHDILKNINNEEIEAMDLTKIAIMTGKSREQIQNAYNKTTSIAKEYGRLNNYELLDKDSLSTIFMKELGYNGIDVRGLSKFDNGTYGSVIYDLENKKNATQQDDIPLNIAPEPQKPISNAQTEQSNETIPMKKISAENGNMELSEGKQRKWIKTSTESNVVNREILPDDLDQTKIFYQPITNKNTLNSANARLGTLGYEKSVEYFNNQFLNKKTTVEDIALGERLIQEAIRNKDTKTAGELIQNVAILGTELGQKVQALSIIQRMTPEGQLKMLEKTINRGKTKGDKSFNDVALTDEMKKKILETYNEDSSYDQDKLNEVMDEVKQEIADQMQVSTMDKVNAWRYLSMLGNPKTHIRNLVSNVAMKGTTAVKNALARTIEDIAPIQNKTKTWKQASQEVESYAKQIALEMKDIISGDNKYSETADIKSKRDIFKNKVLNKLANLNSDLLEKEDWWFSKGAFESSFREFLTANGISTQEDIQNNAELIEKGKQYAVEQAQIATFRQYSWLANKVREIENKNAATNIAVGAVLPFKKTPINIAKTGLSYSPLGFAKTLTYDIAQVKNGKMEASTLIDHLAQNTTGTALTLVGYMLAQAGFINGAGDDDKEGKYDYQLGKQAYSINIGGNTYSISWLSPVAMPLLVGANAYEQLVEGEEWNTDVVLETLGQTLDPLSEMSFLSSLDSVLSSYDSGVQRFFGIGEAMVQNYATQFIPTASSQLAATMDDTKRTTKVSGDSTMKIVDETYNKLIYKIPFLRETLEPTTDIWGNEVKQTENIMQRAFENFISPYTRKESIATEIDEELKDLYSQTGDNGILPNIPYNYVNYDGEKYNMSAKEYTDFKKTYGQTANDLLEDLFRTTTYKNATSEERTDMVNDIYDYANDLAKKEYLAKEGVDYTNTTEEGKEVYKDNAIKGAIENDMTVDEYRMYEDDPDEYKFLMEKDYSYRQKYFKASNSLKEIEKSFSEQKEGVEDDDELDVLYANKKAGIVDTIINSGLENSEKVSLYKKYYNTDTIDTIYKSNISIDDYLTYETKEFKADKNEKGNSIPGSRKEKVINYVNKLEMNIGQKAILIKSTNTFKFNDYNNEIVRYINGLDMTYEERVKILKELDMTVGSDGYVYWED